MKSKNKSFAEIKRFETNPFVVNLKGKMYLQPKANTIVAKGQEIIDTTTGEVIQESVLIGKRKIVDKSQFAKIYASEIGILFGLSKTAINVFLHLSKIMDYENKAILIAENDYTKIGYKTSISVTKGLKELMQNDIIAPHSLRGIYWLNPALICRGERFAKYTEYVTEEHARKQQEIMLKNQGVKMIKELDETTQKKYRKASNQGYINQINIFGEVDKIDPNTGEVIKKNTTV